MAISRAERPVLVTLAAPLACLGYAALVMGAWATTNTYPVALVAAPVILAAGLHSLHYAIVVAILLAGLSIALGSGDALFVHLLPPLAIGIGFAIAFERMRRVRDVARRSGERHALAAEGSGDGLFEWSPTPSRTYFSDTFAHLLGASPTELKGSSDAWFARVHTDDLPELKGDLDRHLAGGSERFENEHRIRRDDGTWHWVLARGMAARDADGNAECVTGWLTDIDDRKRSEDQLRHHAFHDALTGLPNRALFMDRLTHALARARRSPNHGFAIALLDLDRFKQVNDTHGHTAGDELLIAVAHRLESCVRPGDSVARLGGDEFMLLLEDVGGVDEARSVGERVQRALSVPLPLAGGDVVPTASIGIARGESTIEPEALLRDADTAMYEAKSRGGGQLVTFEPRMHDRAVERLKLESALRTAIDRGELQVHYQPILDLLSRNIIGFEALARWRHPSLGVVAPVRFIPLAEDTGLIAEIGAWVLTQAAIEAERLHQLFPTMRTAMHVNLSVRQLQQDAGLVDRVDRALCVSGLAADRLTIEVTESVLMDDAEHGERLLTSLRERGIRVCMDDFGTGYASLSYLHRFRVDSLKIDLSFVRKLTDPTGGTEFVKTILTLARTLGITAIAEGIETPEQLSLLCALGCTIGQGFLFSPPVDAASIESLLRAPSAFA